eukprot:3066548-Amphidinium_carterae.1
MLANGQTSSTRRRVHFTRIRALLGRTMATWRIDDWSRPDSQGNNALWLDHSVAIKPQCVTAGNGLETDHKAAMSLHKWNNEDDNVVADSRIAMRVNNGQDRQLHSRLTILHSHVTVHMDGDSD